MNKAFRPILISLAIVTGIVIGTRLAPSGDSVIFPQKSVIGINKLNEILNYIEESYVDTVEKEKLIEDGIESLLRDLDPHSYYIPKDRYKNMNESLEGNFEGIGVEFRIINDTIMIISAIVDGPSQKAGIRAGDRIVSVEDSVIAGTGIRNEDVMKLLKGERNSIVSVGIKRKAQKDLLNFEITRDKIPIRSVEISYMIDQNTGYIKINRFSRNTFDEFKEASDVLVELGMKNYIVDLRNNPGGLLNEAIKMTDEFLESDKLIVYTEGKSRPRKSHYSSSEGKLTNTTLIVILDEGSASASEVFAGAIQDNDRGWIVGRRSFGKGLVQEQVDWPDGSALRLTVARYYTPTGRSIQKPYKDVDDYHLEAYSRFENGELDSEDSIQLNDSLKYYTPGGSVVYGGGGITPDYFVAVDSLNYNAFYNQLYRKGVIQNYTFHYVDGKRNELLESYRDWSIFSTKFKFTEAEFESFLQYGAEMGVERNPGYIALMKGKIMQDLKAQVARLLYGDKGYYPIVNQSDRNVMKCLDVINQAKKNPGI